MSATARITAFLRAAATRFDDHDSDIARDISRTLQATRPTPPALAPATLGACAPLADMLTGAKDDLTQQLAACLGDLHWRVAGFGKLAPGTDQKLAVVELIGPTGMFAHPHLRIGLLIQREGFHYPRHQHAAEELYFILKGTADWAVDEHPHAPRLPDEFVHHASLQPHGMITRGEPMLAMWGWTGDIDGASYST